MKFQKQVHDCWKEGRGSPKLKKHLLSTPNVKKRSETCFSFSKSMGNKKLEKKNDQLLLKNP